MFSLKTRKYHWRLVKFNMEGLLEQERELELQIDTYKTQLHGVEAQLENGGQDIQQLHDDLSQLIALTEESLVELKKQRLLVMLHPTEAEEGEEQVGVASTADEGDEETEVAGMKCRAPLKESWGSVNYHNAMVLCVELQDEEGDEVKVRVLFTQPLYAGMRPCPFFMDGSCKFSDEDCKFSHGLVVPVSQLHAYHDHDYSLAHIGGKCLAKHSDDLWHPAIIQSMGEQFSVRYTDLNLQADLSPDCVYPMESSDDSDSVSSDSGDVDISDAAEDGDGGDGVEGVRVLGGEPRGSHRPLGEWEKHTTGFGSKLLAKMGYVPGQGLGKSSQGRVEPVEIVILPAGKSLDVCAEMRERKKLRGVDTERQRKRRRKREKAAEIKAATEEKKMDMFEFLNTKIFKKMKSSGEASGSQQKQPKAAKSDNLNVRLFKVQEEMKAVKKRRLSLQQTLRRHQGKNGDKQMEGHVKEKLSAVEKQLSQLQREEQRIEKSITSKSERRKLSVF